MLYIQGTDRNQLTLEPMCLDDCIAEDSICRVIDAYVRSLDLRSLDFTHTVEKATGRPSFNPANMLMLYIYGYMNRVRSSRRLEAETHRNVEVMWLMECLTPDDRTICNFRKDNAAALKRLFREFSLWCSEHGLYGKKLIAVDGTKTRANTSRRNIHNEEITKKRLASIEKKIIEYMSELEENDVIESAEPRLSREAITAMLEKLNERKSTLEERLKLIAESEDGIVSTVDPDARIMHQGGDGRILDACYNVQTVADDKHNLIVDFDVTTCADDKGALPQMTERAKEIMGVDEIAVAADKGYYDGEDIAECERNNTTCYVPKTAQRKTAPDADYNRENFRYDSENDCYICPDGVVLYFKKICEIKGDFYKLYENPTACADCQNRSKCTKIRKGRKFFRSINRDFLDTIDARMLTDEAREIYSQRQRIIEHPFGTTKKIWGFNQFLCRTKEKVTAEQSLVFLAYNLRRVINIFKGNGENLLGVMA